MIKVGMLVSLLVILAGCGDNNKKDDHNDSAAVDKKDSRSYSKNDLKKISWIEGKWRGMYNGKPFYEIYQLVNDSTLEITAYEWSGKDSTKSSKSFVAWNDGSYYLGDEKNYKVISITQQEIKMLPNYKASNDVLWKYVSNDRWDAILGGTNNPAEYHMERFDPWK